MQHNMTIICELNLYFKFQPCHKSFTDLTNTCTYTMREDQIFITKISGDNFWFLNTCDFFCTNKLTIVKHVTQF